MTIKIYGNVLSTASMRAFACLHEKDLDYELVPVDMITGDHKTEPFISLNPFGQVPALEDEHLKLFDSRAINRYLAQAYSDKGTPLIFDDPKKMAIVNVWMEVEAQKYDPHASKLTWELIIKPVLSLPADNAVVQHNESELAKVLDVYEARLANSRYLGGDAYSLADLHHLPTMSYLMGTRVKTVFDSRPHVIAWFKDISSRPAWEKVVALKPNTERVT